jgi:hypothetical protein
MLINATVSALISGDATLTVTASDSGELVAPAGVWFDSSITDDPVGGVTTGQYDPRYHEITYRWTYDDVGSFSNSAALEIPNEWDDRNAGGGQYTAHVFNDAGTYTVTCAAYYDGSQIAQDTAQIVVADPATAYAGTRTILVDPAGTGDNATYPSSQVFTTISAAMSALESLETTGRVLLKRGETFTGVNIDVTSGMDNFRLGAWGSGNKPILQRTANGEIVQFLNASPVKDCMIYDVDFQGPWDSTTETGDPRNEPLYWLTHTGATNPWYCVHRCDFSGFNKVKFGNISVTSVMTTIWSETNVTNWRNYAMYGHASGVNGDGRMAFIGCAFNQDPNACSGVNISGVEGKDGWSNDHGPFRTSSWKQSTFMATEFFSRNGWSKASGGVLPAPQSCIRVDTDPNGINLDDKWNFYRVRAEGGFQVVDADRASASNPDTPMNMLFDGFILIGTSHTWQHVQTGIAPATWRNGVLIMPSVTREPGQDFGEFIDHELDNPQNNIADEPNRFYNLTYLNLDEPTPVLHSDSGIWTDFTNENFVHHGPNQGVPETTSSPIDTTTALVNCRHLGPRYSTEKVRHDLTGDVADGGTVVVSYPSGYGQSDFSATASHGVIIDYTPSGSIGINEIWFRDNGDIAVTFNAGDITVTNNTGATWFTGWRLSCNFERNSFTTLSAYANPATVPIGRQQAGSSAIGGATTGWVAYDDLVGNVRSGSVDDGAWQGT